ncbi:MAG: MarR family transcriptional regulator [Actinomycetota bacterium]
MASDGNTPRLAHADRSDRTPSAASTEDELVGALQRVARHLVGITATAWASVRGPVKITLPAYRLLVLLSSGPQHPKQLAAELGVTRPAVTQMLATLSRQRLVTISRDSTDGRHRVVSISRRSSDIVDAVARERALLLAPVLDRLSRAERERTRQVLDRLDRELSASRIGAPEWNRLSS